jgi:hypothetical protein
LRMQIRRNEQASETSFALGGRMEKIFVLDEDPSAARKAKAIREGLLRGTAAAAAAAAN